MNTFITNLPKAELHVHIEGTLEPELMEKLAERNGVKLNQQNQPSKDFHEMIGFLARYNYASLVLQKEQDFYDLALAYLKKVSMQGVVHTEIFFDIQMYTQRGINADIVINGLKAGLQEGQKLLNISSSLILCFQRDLTEQEAFIALEQTLPHRDVIIGIGLASNAAGNPPSKFKHVFAQARAYGYHIVAHAGEQDGPQEIREALNLLHAERIDHGVRCWEDQSLVQELLHKQIGITICPLSNIALGIYKTLQEHPVMRMLKAGLVVSINSDDPAYFNGYIAENYQAVAQHLGATNQDLAQFARNSINTSFLDTSRKEKYLKQIDDYVISFAS